MIAGQVGHPLVFGIIIGAAILVGLVEVAAGIAIMVRDRAWGWVALMVAIPSVLLLTVWAICDGGHCG